MSIMFGIVCIVAILCITFLGTYLIYAIEQYAVSKKEDEEEDEHEYGANS